MQTAMQTPMPDQIATSRKSRKIGVAFHLRSALPIGILVGGLVYLGLFERFLHRPLLAVSVGLVIIGLSHGLHYLLWPLRVINVAAGFCLVVWAVGQVFRDTTWLTGLMFYIPSLPACLGLSFVAYRNLLARHWAIASLFMAGTLASGYVVLQVDSHVLSAPKTNYANRAIESAIPSTHVPADGSHLTSRSITLVHWNAFDGRLNWPAAHADLVKHAADIYVFSESPSADRISSLARSCTNAQNKPYHQTRAGSLSLLARGLIVAQTTLIRTSALEIQQFDWMLAGQPVRVFGVDLASDIRVARAPQLKLVNEMIDAHQPDIVVGDFNAPRRSIELGRLPRGYRHAYDEIGTGFSYTWPVPIPCYSLDQCILGKKIHASKYELFSTWSDHRAQKLVFEVDPSN